MIRCRQIEAKFRRAKPDDFDVLYDLWMQDHINPFMSFELVSKEAFKPIFESMYQGSDIYVIEDNGQVVAVRRMVFGADDHAHTAEFASFGVHKDHLRKGYGELFYQFFIDKIRIERPDITRIEISQETDNDPAFRLAKKMGFNVEAIFPDWLPRKTGTHHGKWYVGERFCSLWLDPNNVQNVRSTLKKFEPELPLLRQDAINVKMEITENKALAYQEGKLQAVCSLSSGIRRYEHIQFWFLQIEPGCNLNVVMAFLRELAMIASDKHKKIEILTSDQDAVEALAKLGYHYRGEKIASRKIGDHYFNEIAADLSFFGIDDAKKMLGLLKSADNYQLARVSSSLGSCQKAIQNAAAEGWIDQYAAFYLENLAFQMTREGMGETKLTNPTNAPWSGLIEALPEKLKAVFVSLAQATKVIGQVLNSDDAKMTGYTVNRL